MKSTTFNRTEEEALIQAELLWTEAIGQNNVDEMAGFMNDDWVILGTTGGITSKNNFLNAVKSGDLVHAAMHFEIVQARVYDNSGIIIAKGTSTGTYKGNAFSFFEWSTSMYVKKENAWKAVFTMLTPAQD